MTCCGAVQTVLDYIVYRSGQDFPPVFDGHIGRERAGAVFAGDFQSDCLSAGTIIVLVSFVSRLR